MRVTVFILVLLILSSCTLTTENNTFEGRTFKWENVHESIDTSAVDYCLWEFLDKNRLLSEVKTNSIIALQQGDWKYYKSDNKEYLVIREFDQLIDTFELIQNKDYNYFEFINLSGDTVRFEEFKESCKFDTELFVDKKWYCLNDSIPFGFDSITNNLNFIYSEYQFDDNNTYQIKDKTEKTGTWRLNKCKNKILLDSLTDNKEVIKIVKLTIDTLMFWKRDINNKPRKYKFVKGK